MPAPVPSVPRSPPLNPIREEGRPRKASFSNDPPDEIYVSGSEESVGARSPILCASEMLTAKGDTIGMLKGEMLTTNTSPNTIFAGTLEMVPPMASLPPPATKMHGLRVHSGFSAMGKTALLCAGLLKLADLTVAVAQLVAEAAGAFAPSSPGAALAGVFLAGFFAQLVDGSLGMGYGLTSSTVLVCAGLSARTASASVHLAQLGTTLVSGLAHHRHGHVDWPTCWRIMPWGVGGAVLGVSVLSSIPSEAARPVAAALLFGTGAYVLMNSARRAAAGAAPPPTHALLGPLGLLGGFVDATGGGGWGPVATSGLFAHGGLPAAKVIGTVSTSEFFVTAAAVLAFCATSGLGAGADGARLDLVLTLLFGGLIAAPLAPRLVERVQPRLLGVLVGGFICTTNARVLLAAGGASTEVAAAAYVALGTVAATYALGFSPMHLGL